MTVQPPKPDTPEVKRAKQVNARTDSLWNVTTWFWTLFFSGAAVTIYLQSLDDARSAMPLLVLGLLSYVGAAVLYGVAYVIGRSRQLVAERGETPTTTQLWVWIPQLGQAILLLVTTGILIAAVLVAYKDADETPGLDEGLASRVKSYISERDKAEPGESTALGKVVSYCQEHENDDKATRVFGETCEAFAADEAPSREDAAKLQKRLEGKTD